MRQMVAQMVITNRNGNRTNRNGNRGNLRDASVHLDGETTSGFSEMRKPPWMSDADWKEYLRRLAAELRKQRGKKVPKDSKLK